MASGALDEGGPVRVPGGSDSASCMAALSRAVAASKVACGGLRARHSHPGGERVRVRGSSSPSTRDRSATFTAISRMPSRRRPADTGRPRDCRRRSAWRGGRARAALGSRATCPRTCPRLPSRCRRRTGRRRVRCGRPGRARPPHRGLPAFHAGGLTVRVPGPPRHPQPPVEYDVVRTLPTLPCVTDPQPRVASQPDRVMGPQAAPYYSSRSS
jgi:hypothetical protein